MKIRSSVLASFFLLAGSAMAMAGNAPNSQPNPYRTIRDFFKLPVGRTMGSSSAVAVDSMGTVWVADRCGANDCAGSKLDPVMAFDKNGANATIRMIVQPLVPWMWFGGGVIVLGALIGLLPVYRRSEAQA